MASITSPPFETISHNLDVIAQISSFPNAAKAPYVSHARWKATYKPARDTWRHLNIKYAFNYIFKNINIPPEYRKDT